MKEKQTNPAVCKKTAKRILALLLTCCMLVTTLCLPAFAVDSTENSEPVADQTGEGVEAVADEGTGVIEIATADDFLKIKNKLDGNYKLTADIALTDPKPLGTTAFTGTLDGDGHTVTIAGTYTATSSHGMLFGTLNCATVKNLQVGTAEAPMKISGGTSGAKNFGVLSANVVSSTISNVHIYVDADLTDWVATTANFGVFFPRSTTGPITIENCTANGEIDATNLGGLKKIGGFCGTCAVGVTLTNCVNNVDITGSTTKNMYIGGFGGYNASAGGNMTLTNCVNTGAISCENLGTETAECNAIVVDAGGTITTTGCVNIGTVNGETVSEDGIANNLDGITGAIAQTNKGAGVRIVLDDKGTGLRFKFTMDETSIANLDLLSRIYGKDNVQVGAIFLPTDLVGENALTAENYTNAVTMAGSASEVTDGYYHASLVNLYKNHYTTAYSCQSFWRFRTSAEGEWITVYANNTESRTIAVVAADALDDPNKPNYSTEQLAILNAYAGRTN